MLVVEDADDIDDAVIDVDDVFAVVVDIAVAMFVAFSELGLIF